MKNSKILLIPLITISIAFLASIFLAFKEYPISNLANVETTQIQKLETIVVIGKREPQVVYKMDTIVIKATKP